MSLASDCFENRNFVSLALQPLNHVSSSVSSLIPAFAWLTNGFGNHHVGDHHLASRLEEPVQRFDRAKKI